jgi:hypothetical protein
VSDRGRRQVVSRRSNLKEVTHAVLCRTVLVGLVLYRVVEVVRKRRVAHAVRLRRSNVGTIVGRGGVHGSLMNRGAVGLVATRTLVREALGVLAGLSRVARVGRDLTRGGTAGEGSQTTLTLLDLALNAATIGSLADGRQDWAHDLDEMDTQSRWSKLERRLDDIVAVRIAHQVLKLLDVTELLNQHLLGGHLGTADALLDDVGAELLLRELHNLAPEAFTHGRGESSVIQVEDVLDNVVAEWILDKVEAVCSDFANEVNLLIARRMIDATLKNTAAVAVGSDDDTVLAYSVEDELGFRGLEMVQALLDDVIAVQVLDEVDDLARQRLNDHFSLRMC